MSHAEDQDSSSSGEDCESPTFAKKYDQSDTDVQEGGSLRKEEDHSIHLQVNKKGSDLRQV